ncbi:DUF2624 family protein [Texcoconibacillus texcoconensis]|uniref:DNA-directed RNA polymerase specialized sigma subunit n=1 Tax=Texcoconibacillus texcoconensis TaxID=1095777 RepID=A0A840QRG2_9BACI|nr:DUF2624 family protein [Texcoconibacillus texcoconensis]MBB5173913.1 DNA-directed RNA polymerase specialized sigma subunit [Texcoconibacillus texcoconensis]
MNPIVRQMANQKINSLDERELLRLSKEYEIPLTAKQAKEIIQIIHKHPIDVGNEKQVKRLRDELKTLDPKLYRKADKLLTPYKSMIAWPKD